MSAQLSRPVHELQRSSKPAAQTTLAQLAALFSEHFYEIGDHTLAGAYYGRTSQAVRTQASVITEHYFAQTLAGQSLVLAACVRAANDRLGKLKLPAQITASDLGTPAVYTRPSEWRPRGESLPLYLRRLKSEAESRSYIDANPQLSFQALDRFLFEQPGWPELRDAEPVIDHLATNPQLSVEQRLILTGTYEAMSIQAGLRQAGSGNLDWLTEGAA